MKRRIATLLFGVLTSCLLVGCGSVPDSETSIPTSVESVDQETNVDIDIPEASIEASIEESDEKEEQNNEQSDDTVNEAEEYYQAGRAALYGLDGTPINLDDASMNFEKARELGKIDANFYLGVLCDFLHYPKRDFEKARAYYEACSDNPYTQIALGFLYLNGQGVDKDEEKARELFQGVIDQGYPEGYVGIAALEENAENYELRLECYNKALSGTETLYIRKAMYYIGELYEFGHGVEQNYNTALDWFVKSAELGDDYAMVSIGWYYKKGLGVSQDYTKAMDWFLKAVDLGEPSAMNNIGDLCMDGLGVSQDYTKAMDWYLKAADKGLSYAMYNIGYMYENGFGVDLDYAKAMDWYLKAADKGFSTAMICIANLYANGMGVEVNLNKALEWLDKAAELGDEDAAEYASMVRQNM